MVSLIVATVAPNLLIFMWLRADSPFGAAVMTWSTFMPPFMVK